MDAVKNKSVTSWTDVCLNAQAFSTIRLFIFYQFMYLTIRSVLSFMEYTVQVQKEIQIIIIGLRHFVFFFFLATDTIYIHFSLIKWCFFLFCIPYVKSHHTAKKIRNFFKLLCNLQIICIIIDLLNINVHSFWSLYVRVECFHRFCLKIL